MGPAVERGHKLFVAVPLPETAEYLRPACTECAVRDDRRAMGRADTTALHGCLHRSV